jgi:SEC-C motif domain protein
MDPAGFCVAALARWRRAHLLYAEDGPWRCVARLRQALTARRLDVLECFLCTSVWTALPAATLVSRRRRELPIAWPALRHRRGGGPLSLLALCCDNGGMDGRACPCGSGDAYDACCGRLHAGAPAPTAEALMRARYSAFAVGDVGYLIGTYHRARRPEAFSLDPAIAWTRLAVLDRAGGRLFDDAGTVRFRAVYVRDGRRGVLDENSRFVREDGRWTYVGPVD